MRLGAHASALSSVGELFVNPLQLVFRSEVDLDRARPCRLRTMRTRVPSAKRSRSSAARVCTSFVRTAPASRGARLAWPSSRAPRSRAPTRLRATTSRATRRWSPSSAGASSARACPIESAPDRDVRAHFLRQLQQPDVVGDRRSILARPPSAISFLRELVLVGESAVRVRFFDRVQILALDVLDERHLEQRRSSPGDVADDDRHLEQAGALRRAPAPFAGDDLVAAVHACGRRSAG